MNQNWPLKQTLLRILVGAVILSALIGIYAVLFGKFGKTELKILLTTLTVSYFSVTSLACAAAFEKRIFPWLTVPGLATACIGFLTFVYCIWAEHDSGRYANSMITLGLFSFSFAQACLLSLAKLGPRFQWVLYFTLGSIFAGAGLILHMIVFQFRNEMVIRLAVLIGILDGCGTLSIPVLYKLGTNRNQFAPGSFQAIELRCPRCGQRGTFPIGEIVCQNCSLRIRVEVG